MSLRDIAIAVLVVGLWSTSIIVQKIAVEHISVYLLSFLRMGLIAPFIIFYLKPKLDIFKYLLCGLFWYVLNVIFVGSALKLGVGAGLSSFLILTNSLFGILFCFLLVGEKPKNYEIVGMGFAFSGVFALTANPLSDQIPYLGIALLIGCSMSWGVGFAFIKKFKIGKTMSDNIWLSAISTIPLGMFCLVMDGPSQSIQGLFELSSTAVACVVYISFVPTLIGSYLWMSLGQRVHSSSMMPFMLLLPVFSCLQSWLFFGEQLTPYQLMSGLIILMGVVITQNGLRMAEVIGLKRRAIVKVASEQ